MGLREEPSGQRDWGGGTQDRLAGETVREVAGPDREGPCRPLSRLWTFIPQVGTGVVGSKVLPNLV